MGKTLEVSKFVINIFWSYSKTITFMRVASFVFVALEPLIDAIFIAYLIDLLINGVEAGLNDTSFIISTLIFLGFLYSIQRIFTSMDRATSRIINQIVRFHPKVLMYSKLNMLQVRDLEDADFQNRLQRFGESIYAFQLFFESILGLLGMLVVITFSSISLITILPEVILFLVVINIPIILVSNHYIKKDFKLKVDSSSGRRRADMLVNYMLDANKYKEIKINNAFEYIKEEFEQFHKGFTDKFIDIRIKWNLATFPLYLIEIIIRLYGMYIIVNLAMSGDLSIGSIAYYFAAISILSTNMRRLSSGLSNLKDNALNLFDVYEIFETKESIDADFSDMKINSAPAIKIDNVSFKYPNTRKYVLKDFSLEIRPGEKIAIVGENGAGKTTLVKLLSRVYDVTKGNILIDGVSLYDIDTDDWYHSLGLLFQDFNTYEPLTVRENIAIGDITKPIDEELIKDALTLARADKFVREYKEGLDKILSEKFKNGIRPSGGQWQKIAIARFFYRNAPVLIMDEPTSAIDAIAEEEIFKNIYETIQDKTVIIVSHRFSTVRNADRIIVIEDGSIREQGTHEELLRNGKKYAQMFNAQAKGYV